MKIGLLLLKKKPPTNGLTCTDIDMYMNKETPSLKSVQQSLNAWVDENNRSLSKQYTFSLFYLGISLDNNLGIASFISYSLK